MNEIMSTRQTEIDALEDEGIDTSDIPLLGDDFFAKAQWRIPEDMRVSVPIDMKTMAWYQKQGEGFLQQMAAALRIYAEAHQSVNEKHKAA